MNAYPNTHTTPTPITPGNDSNTRDSIIDQDAEKVMNNFYAPGVDKPIHQMSIPPNYTLQPGVPSGTCLC